MLHEDFLRTVPLPDELEPQAIFEAMKKTQEFFALIRSKTQINLSRIIQSNNFSGVVSNVFTQRLHEVSPYRVFHDQRYPDLKHEKLGIGLEVKAANKPMKGGEGHNGHSGWHIIVCFEAQENGDIEFIQAEIADLIGFGLPHSDWVYQGSRRNDNDSQRTETYITTAIGTAKLRDGSIYLNTEKCRISRQMLAMRQKITTLPIPPFSPFSQE